MFGRSLEDLSRVIPVIPLESEIVPLGYFDAERIFSGKHCEG